MNVDYAARFEGLNSDVLFELEDQANDVDAARDYIESLLVVLADWRRHLIEQTDPAGEVEYTRCLNTVREAWLQHSFRWIGGPTLPYPFDLPTVTA